MYVCALQGPNQCWSADGYDKLKFAGLPIHGMVDVFSRYIFYLDVFSSNNDPEQFRHRWRNVVCRVGGVPERVCVDLGNENDGVAEDEIAWTGDEVSCSCECSVL